VLLDRAFIVGSNHQKVYEKRKIKGCCRKYGKYSWKTGKYSWKTGKYTGQSELLKKEWGQVLNACHKGKLYVINE